MSLDDFKDLGVSPLVIRLLGWVFVGVLTYLVTIVLGAVSKADVKEMINEAIETSQYAQDKGSIDKAMQDLYMLMAKSEVADEKIKDAAQVQAQKLWAELAELKAEIEKLHLKTSYIEDRGHDNNGDPLETETHVFRRLPQFPTTIGDFLNMPPGE